MKKRNKQPQRRHSQADRKMAHRWKAAPKSQRPVVRQGRELNDPRRDDERAWLRDL